MSVDCWKWNDETEKRSAAKSNNGTKTRMKLILFWLLFFQRIFHLYQLQIYNRLPPHRSLSPWCPLFYLELYSLFFYEFILFVYIYILKFFSLFGLLFIAIISSSVPHWLANELIGDPNRRWLNNRIRDWEWERKNWRGAEAIWLLLYYNVFK